MQSLRILIVMVEPPLPFGNAAARWYYVLFKGLVERGHRVTAFATCSKPSEIEEAGRLFPAPAYDLRCYPHPNRNGLGAKIETLRRPYSYMFSPQLRDDLEAQIEKGCDVLHLEQLWSGWMGTAQPSRTLLNVHYLPSLDLRGNSGFAGPWAAYRLALRGERALLRRFRWISAFTPRLAEQVRRVNSAASVAVIPLAIDTSLYALQSRSESQRPMVSLIGSFDWLPTLKAGIRILTHLWPSIRAACPEARLQLVGRNARLLLGHVSEREMEGVSIEENVPDTLPYFDKTDVLLYPAERASGMKVKVLEAFALGVPVVTTSAGIEGLPARDGIHAGIAEDNAALVARTVSLLRSSVAREKQRVAARELVERYCSPASTLDVLEAVYTRMVSEESDADPKRTMAISVSAI